MGAGIDAFYWCPHRPDDNCDCRKPKTKMVRKAARELHIDLKYSMLIGDTDRSDGELARNLGIKDTILNRRRKPGNSRLPARPKQR
jgi:histidinol-phosphate phosphatase family protein